MPNFDILAGDFGQKKIGSIGRDQVALPGAFFFKPEVVPITAVKSLDMLNEESAKKFAGSIGMGVVGFALLGPLGGIAGVLAGGNKRTVVFTLEFEDGRRLMGSAKSSTFTQIQAALFSHLSRKLSVGRIVDVIPQAADLSATIAPLPVLPSPTSIPVRTSKIELAKPAHVSLRASVKTKHPMSASEKRGLQIWAGCAAWAVMVAIIIGLLRDPETNAPQISQTAVTQPPVKSKFVKGSWEEAYETFNQELLKSGAEDHASPFGVSADPGAQYVMIGHKVVPSGLVLVTTRRIGSSGRSYSTRLVNCERNSFMYVGEGDSLASINFSPDPSMASLVTGSSSYHTVKTVCQIVK